MKHEILSSEALTDLAIKGLEEKKGIDIVKVDLRNIESAITDYFVICTGSSDRHVQALGESVLEFMTEHKEKPICKEGMRLGEWVVLDYVTVVVHIFQKEKRAFYRLEDLWGDAVVSYVEESILTGSQVRQKK